MYPSRTLAVSPGRGITPASAVAGLVSEWHAALDLQVRAGELAATTADTYRRGAHRFLSWCCTLDVHNVNGDALREWMAFLQVSGCKPSTVQTWFAGVRALYGWATSTHRLTHNPTRGVKGPRRKGANKNHRRQPLSDAEVRRVLAIPGDDAAGLRDRAMLFIMAFTGARTVELQRADLSNLRTEAGRLVLDVQGKGRDDKDELIVIANPDAQTSVHDWLAARGDKPGPLFVSFSPRSRGKRLGLRAIRGIVKAAYKAAGVRGEGKTTHSLRHTAITKAIQNGAPIQRVQAMARHANIGTTMIYFHEMDRLAEPAEALIDYGSG